MAELWRKYLWQPMLAIPHSMKFWKEEKSSIDDQDAVHVPLVLR
jgi:hypothetical protein